MHLHEVCRSADWLFLDTAEIKLIAAGLLEQVPEETGHATVRVTASGIAPLTLSIQRNWQNRSAHEILVNRIDQEILRYRRVVWTGLRLRAGLTAGVGEPVNWKMCQPYVLCIRNTTIACYLEPIVHEIKIRWADLLGDLKCKDKRNSYLDVGNRRRHALECDSKGRIIEHVENAPAECGVLIAEPDRLSVARYAENRPSHDLPFAIWMALANPLRLIQVNL